MFFALNSMFYKNINNITHYPTGNCINELDKCN